MEALGRIVKLGFTNYWRNRWLTLGATLLMTLTLTMISVAVMISFMIRDTSQAIRSKISLSVYFRDDSLQDQKITDLMGRIKLIPGVTDVSYIDKSQALSIFKRLPINENIKQPVNSDFNPLPRSLEVKTNNVDDIQSVVNGIEQADTEKIVCQDCVSYAKNKEIVDNLVKGTRTAQQAGWLLSIFFGIIAIFNVYNIIRLTITARSDEIEIMRFVGASNAFIRGPFIVEGLLYGLIATLITTIFLPLITKIISIYKDGGSLGSLGGAFSVLNTDLYGYVVSHLAVLVEIQLVIGVFLGIVVSLFSIRKYLHA